LHFVPTKFENAWLIEPERHEDARGFFARTWCQREFAEHGLNPNLVQCSSSFNLAAGTLRGMHFQTAPYEEAKLVRCTQGSIFDVIVDVRQDSPTFGVWQGFELSSANRHSIYIPEGFAHGFQTLTPDSEILYQMSEFFHADAAKAFHHADPQVGIKWPVPVSIISDRDRELPALAATVLPIEDRRVG
jgi:dTDP-4-dehydrorhamnose 3,5-epimerase